MVEQLLFLEQATQFVIHRSADKPATEQVVDTLIESEKNAKKTKTRYTFEELLGTWRLCFITGTKKTRQKAGIVMGSGRYLPNWVNIQLSYSSVSAPNTTPESFNELGQMQNSVEFGSLNLILTGPAKFIAQNNILAFDFTRMTIKLFGIQLYDGYIRGGQLSEEKFASERISKQAFFVYFLITDRLIAARGRGGGLALWGRLR